MGKTFTLLAIALLAACALWLWLSLRRYAARRRREEERATAFMAEVIRAAKKAQNKASTS
jgi:type II secretory pathway pseudopilin PulG